MPQQKLTSSFNFSGGFIFFPLFLVAQATFGRPLACWQRVLGGSVRFSPRAEPLRVSSGVQRQIVHCVEKLAGIVEERHCDALTRPDDQQRTCSEEPCPARSAAVPLAPSQPSFSPQAALAA